MSPLTISLMIAIAAAVCAIAIAGKLSVAITNYWPSGLSNYLYFLCTNLGILCLAFLITGYFVTPESGAYETLVSHRTDYFLAIILWFAVLGVISRIDNLVADKPR